MTRSENETGIRSRSDVEDKTPQYRNTQAAVKDDTCHNDLSAEKYFKLWN